MRISKANRLSEVKEYYFSRKLKEIREMELQGRNIINLGIGSPDLAPDKRIIDKLIEEGLKKENHAYQPYSGVPELRDAFSVFYKKYFHVNLKGNEILPLMGSKEGIMHISMAFLNAGDAVLVPNPGYPTYSAVSNLLGAKVITYDLLEDNNWYPDFEEIEKYDLSQVKIMWVNYPNMPTGTKATKELFQKLVDFGLKHHILIVNDNPYSFILNNEQLSILEADHAKDIALELNSLSKSHNMAGWRIGMLAGSSDYINAVLQAKSNMDSGMFKPLQMAAVDALSSDDSWYASLNEIYDERRRVVFQMLDILGFTYRTDQVGMFVWAKISEKYQSAEEFSDQLLNSGGVFITPGSIFGNNGSLYVRISLCADIQVLRAARNIISQFVEMTDPQNEDVMEAEILSKM